jgi:hypothetical protein
MAKAFLESSESARNGPTKPFLHIVIVVHSYTLATYDLETFRLMGPPARQALGK